MNWFRLYEGTSCNPKLRLIAVKASAPIHQVLAVWIFMMEKASQNSPRGILTNWDPEICGIALDIDPKTVETIRSAMVGKLLEDCNKSTKLIGWDRRQPVREGPSTQRVNDWRKKKKDQERVTETQGNTEKHGNGAERKKERGVGLRPNTSTLSDNNTTSAREVGANGLTAAPPSALPSKGNGSKPKRPLPIGPDGKPTPRHYFDPDTKQPIPFASMRKYVDDLVSRGKEPLAEFVDYLADAKDEFDAITSKENQP